MAKKETKQAHAAHIKQHTVGTSNELSFSVLDAAKSRADAEDGKGPSSQATSFGRVSMFSLPTGARRKKRVTTPTQDNVLPLSTGETIVTPAGGSAKADQGTFQVKINRGASGQAGGLALGGPLGGAVASGGTLGKALGQAYGSPEVEIERRKSRRRRRRTVTVLLGVAVALVALGAVGYFLYTGIMNQQYQVDLLKQALAQIEQVDQTVVPIDGLVDQAGEEIDPDTVNGLLAAIPDAYSLLDSAQGMATRAGQNMRGASDKNAADQAVQTIAARRSMLDAAKTLLQADLDAYDATQGLTQAWDTVLQADGIARDAAAQVTDTTTDNVTASLAKSQQALDLFTNAQDAITQAANSPLKPDLQIYLDYVAQRITSMNAAIASDNAILAQDPQTAASQNDAYNASEDQAAQMARQLPTDLCAPIVSAHTDCIAAASDAYAQARTQASTADAFLRDYLGT